MSNLCLLLVQLKAFFIPNIKCAFKDESQAQTHPFFFFNFFHEKLNATNLTLTGSACSSCLQVCFNRKSPLRRNHKSLRILQAETLFPLCLCRWRGRMWTTPPLSSTVSNNAVSMRCCYRKSASESQCLQRPVDKHSKDVSYFLPYNTYLKTLVF